MCFVLIYILGKNLTRVRRILLLQAGPDIRTTPRESNHAMCITQPRRITSGHSHKHNPIDPDQPSPIIRACGHSNYNPQSNVLWSAAHSTAVHIHVFSTFVLVLILPWQSCQPQTRRLCDTKHKTKPRVSSLFAVRSSVRLSVRRRLSSSSVAVVVVVVCRRCGCGCCRGGGGVVVVVVCALAE